MRQKKKGDLSHAELMMMTIADVIKQLIEAHEQGRDVNLNKLLRGRGDTERKRRNQKSTGWTSRNIQNEEYADIKVLLARDDKRHCQLGCTVSDLPERGKGIKSGYYLEKHKGHFDLGIGGNGFNRIITSIHPLLLVYILTAIDYLSRWVEAFPLSSKSASEVTNSMYKMLVRCGCPQQILTDLGPEFNNKFNLYICERLGIKRSFTSPYHPQTNGLAENANKSIKSTVKNIEVTATEEEEYVGQDVSSNDTSDADDNFDMFMEEVEDKQWILKVKLVMAGKHTETRGQSEKNQIVWLFISLPETKKLGYWCIFEPCGRESRWKESVEDYCIYCNFVICEKESEDCTMVQCDSCKRWAHMPCITEGTNQENLTDEKKEYKCKKCALFTSLPKNNIV